MELLFFGLMAIISGLVFLILSAVADEGGEDFEQDYSPIAYFLYAGITLIGLGLYFSGYGLADLLPIMPIMIFSTALVVVGIIISALGVGLLIMETKFIFLPLLFFMAIMLGLFAMLISKIRGKENLQPA